MINKKVFNLIPDLTLIGSIIFAYILNDKFPITQIIPPPLNTIGTVLSLISIAIAIRTISFLRAEQTSTNASEDPNKFIKTGTFSITRNPIYLAYVLFSLGVSITFGSFSTFIVPIITFCILNFLIIPFEEKAISRTYGQEYEQYKKSVRRWI